MARALKDHRSAQAVESLPIIPALFLVTLIIPVLFQLGPIRLTPYRILLLATFFPALFTLFSGRAGPVRGFDLWLIFSIIWACLALFYNHGIENMLETAGIYFVETLGCYLIARVYITNSAKFAAVCRIFLLIVMALFPFALYEAMTGRPILIEMAHKVGGSFLILNQQPRLGMERAQVVFDHSILYGAFVAALFGPIHYVLNDGKGMVRRAFNYAIGFWGALFSVSGGALVALFFQIGLFAWDRLTRKINRSWTILALLFLLAYILVDLFSNRSPFHVFVSYLTFSPESAYNRILIWNFGTENVAANPIFGIGLGDWARPAWMGDSVDNFWLVIAMRYGLPGVFTFSVAVLWIIRAASLRHLPDPADHAGRAAFLTSLGGMILAGFTVHYWNAIYVFWMFLLGSGVWATYAGGVDVKDARPAPGDVGNGKDQPDLTQSAQAQLGNAHRPGPVMGKEARASAKFRKASDPKPGAKAPKGLSGEPPPGPKKRTYLP